MILKVYEVYDFNELYNTSWSGAIDTLDTIREHDKENDLLTLINDILEGYDGGLDRTQLNDYIWFDRDDIYESLGIDTDE
jgi:hypothetical protein